MRVAGAIHFLVVVQCDIEGGRRGTAPLFEQLPAGLGVAFHDAVLVLGQAAGLVEHIQRHQGLAKIVHQPAHGRVAALRLVQAQLARQGHHQRAHGHRVHVGVVVTVLQTNDAHQGAGVAHHRRGHLFHQRHGAIDIDGLAQAHIVEQGRHRLAALQQNALGLHQLLAHAGASLPHRRWCRGGCRRWGGWRCRLSHGHRRRVGQSTTAGKIDPQLAHPTGRDRIQVFLIFQQKGTAPERVVQPGPFKLVHIHA